MTELSINDADFAIIKNAKATPSILNYEQLKIGGTIYDSQGSPVLGAQRNTNGIWEYVDPIVAPADLDWKKTGSGVYLGHFFDHFGHFLIETFPQLIFALERSDKLFFHAFPADLSLERIRNNSFIMFILKSLEIHTSQIHLISHHVVFEEIVLPPRSFLVRGMLDWSLEPLVSKVLRNIPFNASYNRVYFTRSQLPDEARKLHNEVEIEQIFREGGFEIVAPETLSAEEQISIVASAKVIAGIDGSAMHLSMFMKDGGHSIIINTRNRAVAFSRLNELSGVQTHWVDFNASSEEEFDAFLNHLSQCIDVVTLNSVSSVKESS